MIIKEVNGNRNGNENYFLQKWKIRMEFTLKWNWNGNVNCLTRVELE